MQSSKRLRMSGVALLLSSCIYPTYLIFNSAIEDTIPPIDISLPTDRRILKIPFTVKTTSAYIPYVTVNSGQEDERTKCLIQFSQDGCSKKMVPLTFDWQLTDSVKGVTIARGRYGNRNDYFSAFASGSADKNPSIGCEFAWLEALRYGHYELVLHNLFVPVELTLAKPRLRMEIHNNPYELLNIVPGICASAFACLIAIGILITDFVLRNRQLRS